MKYLFLLLLAPAYVFGQFFEAVPKEQEKLYQFNIKENFFHTEADYYREFSKIITELNLINNILKKKGTTSTLLTQTILRYSNAEKAYRIVDLYLFLRFAVNMNDVKADRESDSLRTFIRVTRQLVKEKIANLTSREIKEITKYKPSLAYYLQKTRDNSKHLLNAASEKIVQPFTNLQSADFYGQALQKMKFETLKTPNSEIDVFKDRGQWENHPDSTIQLLGQEYLLKGYNTQRDFIGYNYIQYIKGLNAYAKTKKFHSLFEEKAKDWGLETTDIEKLFDVIIKGATKRKSPAENRSQANNQPIQFNIKDACTIIKSALKVLGNDYGDELAGLLDPANGRIDLKGDSNRMPIRGMASVYPVSPSIFFAYNYEGYLLDLTLLAHEAGHAIQATLMEKNNVPLLYATGPGYFTESFGKLNELLLFDYLTTHETDSIKRKVYKEEWENRLSAMFGSAMEAYVEHSLIDGILNGSIQTPDDLDSITLQKGSLITPEIFTKIPSYKSSWLLLESNYQAPLHNIDDMIATALSIYYYRLYKTDKDNFIKNYIHLLKNGYHDDPDKLLKKLGINLKSPSFIQSVIDFIISNR
ncbi:M3 family metallopeptidase [Sediminibacterium goheungense]|uniref:Oligopeptidase F n=1 Tax=Sediminibacterium goheungense TaxID=1086393 RepID=A0A4R6J1T4_9BACT|nr:M3 family metallopeptidase [Sediminibacterium goheungense]TDO28125.1 oligopeptidase F [Sediminibacterium goheungense]